MACDINKMKVNTLKLMRDQAYITSTGKRSNANNISIKDNKIIIKYNSKQSLANNLPAALRQRNTILSNIDKELKNKEFPIEMKFYESLRNIDDEQLEIHLQIPQELIKMYELRNKAEEENLEIEQLIREEDEILAAQSVLERETNLGINEDGDSVPLADNNIFEDIDIGSETIVKGNMPFKYSIDKISKGSKKITVRPNKYASGVYKDKSTGKLVNVQSRGNQFLNDFLKTSGISKEQFVKDFISKEEVKYEHIEQFLNNEIPLEIYQLGIYAGLEDIDTTPGFTPFDVALNQRKVLLDYLISKRRNTSDITVKRDLQEKIIKLKANVEVLSNPDERSFDFLVELMLNDVRVVKDKLSSVNDKDGLEYLTALIFNYPTLFRDQFYTSVSMLEGDNKSKYLEGLESINNLLRRIRDKQLRIADAKVKDVTGEEILDVNGLLIKAKDISSISKKLLSANDFNHPLIKTISKLISDAQDIINNAYLSFRTTHRNITKSLVNFQKSKGINKNNIYDYMLQVDDKGKRTGRHVNKFSSKYFLERSESNNDPIERLKFYADNHSFTISEEAWNVRKERERNYFMYELDIVPTVAEVEEGITIEQLRERKFQAWVNKNNPEVISKIIDRAKKGKINNYDARTFDFWMKKGGLIPETLSDGSTNRIIEFEPSDKWIDSKWTAIQNMDNSDPRKIFYNHYVENVTNSYKKMTTVDKWLDWSYIPEMTNTSTLVNGVRQWMVGLYSDNLSQRTQVVNPITGELSNTIPRYMTGQNLPLEDKSFDLGEVLDKFVNEGYRFEEYNKIESDVQFLLGALKDVKVYQVDWRGNIKRDPNTNEPLLKEGASNLFDVAQYKVEALLYHQSQKVEGNTGKKVYSPKTKDRRKEIDKEAKALNLTIDEKEIGLEYVRTNEPYGGKNEKIKKYIDLKREFNKLGFNYRIITVSKIVNSLIAYTAVRFLGLNPFSSIGETIQGFYTLNLIASGSIYFNKNQAISAIGDVIQSIGGKAVGENATKVRRLSELFGSTSNKSMGLDENDNKVSSVFFAAYKAANYLTNNSMLVAMLKNKKIKDNAGNEHSLYDVLQIDENFKLSLKGDFNQEYFYDLNGTPTEEYFELFKTNRKILTDFRDRRSDTDPIEGDKYALFRLLGQFKKTWMIKGFHTRFKDSGDVDGSKGFYKTLFDLFEIPKKENAFGELENDLSVSSIAKMLGKGIAETFKYTIFAKAFGLKPSKELSKNDQANMKMVLTELGTALTLLIMTTLLVAMLKGDDDDEPFFKYAINQLVRLQRDVTTYISPSSLGSIIKNPLPAYSTITDIQKLLGKLASTPRLISSDYDLEDLKLGKSARSLIPGVRQIQSTYDKFYNTVQYRD